MFQGIIIFVRDLCHHCAWSNWDLDTPMYFLQSTKEEQLHLQICLLIVPNPVEVRNKGILFTISQFLTRCFLIH